MKTTNTRQLAFVGLMTAILCIMAPFSILLPFSPIPMSLGTLAVYFCAILLGRKLSLLSVSIYLLLGFVGLPVFSGFTGGAGKLFGPTGGYLIGYLFLTLICGTFADKFPGRTLPCLGGMILGTLVCYLFGTVWLSYQSSLTFSQTFYSAILPFLPGDILKMIAGACIGLQIRKRLYRLLL